MRRARAAPRAPRRSRAAEPPSRRSRAPPSEPLSLPRASLPPAAQTTRELHQVDGGGYGHCDQEHNFGNPGCVYLLAGGGVVYGHEDETNSKVPMAYAMLEAIASRRPHPKPVSFYIDLRASGSRFGVGKKHTINEPAPIFSIAHKTAENGRGLLVPNPYFLDPSWWANYTRAVMALAARRPWHSRRTAVLMRGACGPASFERLGVLKLPEFTNASRYDFGIVSKAGPYENIEDCIEKGMKDSSTEAEIARVKSRIMPKMPLEDFSRYRYVLHMPGSVTNSYSRNLQHLFMQGVIVLVWQSDAVEFYYPLLRPRVHFMSVNASTLEATVHELESSPRLRRHSSPAATLSRGTSSPRGSCTPAGTLCSTRCGSSKPETRASRAPRVHATRPSTASAPFARGSSRRSRSASSTADGCDVRITLAAAA